MEIKRKITPYNFSRVSNRDIKYIVIHYVGAVSSAKNNASYYANNRLSASAHYFVDENEIWQSVEEHHNAWHCGGGLQGNNGHSLYKICFNSNSIGIEMCCKKKNGEWYFEPETVENTVKLTRHLIKKYNIPIGNIIRHYDVTGKNCPAPYVNETEWAKFKMKITGEDELTLSQYEELKQEIEALKKANKIYHYFDELPDYAKDIILELYRRGIYKGASASDLNLPEALMRTLVINYRAGLYDK